MFLTLWLDVCSSLFPHVSLHQEKALNLQAAGAIGMVVWNRVEPNFLFLMGTDGTGRDVRFPVAMISEADGAFLSGCMAAQPQSRPLTVTIRRDSYQPGDQVPVPPLPVSAGQRRPAAAASAAAQSQSQRDLHVQLSGTIDHFSFKVRLSPALHARSAPARTHNSSLVIVQPALTRSWPLLCLFALSCFALPRRPWPAGLLKLTSTRSSATINCDSGCHEQIRRHNRNARSTRPGPSLRAGGRLISPFDPP